MKRGRVFQLSVSFVLCVGLFESAGAAPGLDLSMEFNWVNMSAEVHRANTDFGLGALAYDLQFSELLNLTREYSDYGWVANDGLFDSSNPVDGTSNSFASIRFDTVHSPAGSEFSAGTAGVVESLTVLDLTPRWVYFDISSPVATNGAGSNLVSGLGGTLTVLPDDNPDAPEQGHTLAVYIPEPMTMLLLGLGGIFTLRKRGK